MRITIDKNTPSLTGQEAADFFNFLRRQQEQQNYFVKPNTAFTEGTTVIQFKQPMFFSFHESESTYTCDILGSKALGFGGYAEVFSVEKGYTATTSGLTPKSDYPAQVVKIQRHCQCQGLEKQQEECKTGKKVHNSRAMLEHEFKISQTAPHLEIQPPIFNKDQWSFLKMKQQPGNELYDLIVNPDLGSPGIIQKLSVGSLVALSISILEAIQRQVVEPGIWHGDLTPQNVIVNQIIDTEQDTKFEANIIDYAGARSLDLQAHSPTLTIGYNPPERLLSPYSFGEVTEKTDPFSAGRMLVLIFGGSDTSYNRPKDLSYEAYVTRHREYLKSPDFKALKNLFRSFTQAQQEELKHFRLAEQIRAILQKMLAEVASERISIDKAVEAFQKIAEEIKARKAKASETTMSRPAVDPRQTPHASGLSSTSSSFWRSQAPTDTQEAPTDTQQAATKTGSPPGDNPVQFG